MTRRLGALATGRPTAEVLYAFVQDSGLLGQLVVEDTPEAEERVRNISKLFTITQRVGGLLEHDRVDSFIRYLDLLIESGDDPAAAEVDIEVDAVHLLTAHNAKGLEFPVVFVVSLVDDRFPARGRAEGLPLPAELVAEPPAQGDVRLEEERRLFYVAMTRSREELVLTHAADYGGRTRRKMSRFVAEALGLPAAPPGRQRLDPREAIERFAPAATAPAMPRAPLRDDELLRLSSSRIDDYLTCPLKYRYAHEVQVPLTRSPVFMYGDAVHNAIRVYYQHRLRGDPIVADDVVQVFEQAWSSEGFISREHEERRLAQGREALRRFVAREEQHPPHRAPGGADLQVPARQRRGRGPLGPHRRARRRHRARGLQDRPGGQARGRRQAGPREPARQPARPVRPRLPRGARGHARRGRAALRRERPDRDGRGRGEAPRAPRSSAWTARPRASARPTSPPGPSTWPAATAPTTASAPSPPPGGPHDRPRPARAARRGRRAGPRGRRRSCARATAARTRPSARAASTSSPSTTAAPSAWCSTACAGASPATPSSPRSRARTPATPAERALDRGPARRHHELRAQLPVLLRLDRGRGRRAAGRRRGLRPGARRAVRGRRRARRHAATASPSASRTSPASRTRCSSPASPTTCASTPSARCPTFAAFLRARAGACAATARRRSTSATSPAGASTASGRCSSRPGTWRRARCWCARPAGAVTAYDGGEVAARRPPDPRQQRADPRRDAAIVLAARAGEASRVFVKSSLRVTSSSATLSRTVISSR